MRHDTKTATTRKLAVLSKTKAPKNPARLKAFYQTLIARFNALPRNVQGCLWIGRKNTLLLEDREYYYMRCAELHGVLLKQRKPTGNPLPAGVNYSEHFRIEVAATLPSVTKQLAKAEVNDTCPFEPCAWETRTCTTTPGVSLQQAMRYLGQGFSDLKWQHTERDSKLFGLLN